MINLKSKKYKWVAIVLSIFLLSITFFYLTKLFEKTDLYRILSGRSITVKEIMDSNENLGFFDRSKYGGEGTGLRLHRVYSNSKDIVTGFNYLMQFQDFNHLFYLIEYIPKDISKILNQLPNLKSLNISGSRNLSYFKDLKYIEILDITGGNLSELSTTLNTYEKIKEFKWQCNYDYNYQNNEFSISNTTLEKLDFLIDIDDHLNPMENTNFKLHTPNLKDLRLKEWEGYHRTIPINIILENENSGTESFNLETLYLKNIKNPKIEALGNPIRTKELLILNPYFESIDLEHFLKSIYVDALEKFVLVDDTLELANIEYLKNLNNVKELALSTKNMTNLNVITDMQNIQKLYIGSSNLENINSIDSLKNLTNLGLYSSKINDYSLLLNLKDLKELIVPYSSLEKLPNLDGLESLILIYESKEDYEKDLPLQLNGKFKDVEISFMYSGYLYFDYNFYD